MNFSLKTNDKIALMILGQMRLEDKNETPLEKYNYHTKFFKHDNLYLWQWEDELKKHPEIKAFKCKKLIVRSPDQPILTQQQLDLIPVAYQRTWDYYEDVKHDYIHMKVEDCYDIIPGLTKQFYQIGEMFKECIDDNQIFIKTRYDLKYKMNFDMSKFKDILLTSKPVAFVPLGADTPKGRGLADLFYIMNRSAAQLMQDYLYKALEIAEKGGPIHHESFFRYFLKNHHNVNLYRFNFNLTRLRYEILDMPDYCIDFQTNAVFRDKHPHIFECQD